MESKKQTGITLIALVITIIVLLILAGVTINLLLGEHGIFGTAEGAAQNYTNAQKEEVIGLKEFNNNVEKIIQNGIVDEPIDITKYINERIAVDKIIYIDAEKGSDETGKGTKEKPYATLGKITEEGVIEENLSYAIILADGTYTTPENLFSLRNSKSLHIFGNKEKTNLVTCRYGGTAGTFPAISYDVYFYRLILIVSPGEFNWNYWSTGADLWFNNVVFDVRVETAYATIFSKNVIFNNCISIGNYDFLVRTDSYSKELTNCYGKFKDTPYCIDDSWNKHTNRITATPSINSTTYRITENESNWKNVGTGTNPDGTQANLGVYGGEYSWEK